MLDWLFYRGETRQLRSNLWRLIRQTGESEDLQESLGRALNGLCSVVSATYGLILTCERQTVKPVAAFHWSGTTVTLPPYLPGC